MSLPDAQPDSPNPTPLRRADDAAPAPEPRPDPEWNIRRAFGEDPRRGCELLFRRYYAPLCSHAVRFVYSRAIAEDIVAEVFYNFWKTQAYADLRCSYRTYLYQAVRYRVYNHAQWEFNRHDDLDKADEVALPASLRPDQEVQFDELYHRLEAAIASLPPQSKRVFMLSRFEGKKYGEIAEELGISPKTVEVHIGKALAYLRNRLRGEWLPVVLLLSWLATR
jgi:RNA polymerase sigma-70 factor (ECF subfamily)